MVKLKYMALAAGLAFASPSFAAPDGSVSATNTAGSFSTDSSFSLVTGTYNFGLSLLSSFTAPGAASALAELYSVSGNTSTLVSSLQTGTFSFSSAPTSALKASTSSLLSLVGGDYKLTLLGFSAGTTTSTATVTAVPGPEAGTGIAALAMAGIGALAYRRKQKTLA